LVRCAYLFELAVGRNKEHSAERVVSDAKARRCGGCCWLQSHLPNSHAWPSADDEKKGKTQRGGRGRGHGADPCP
jgi:hypothetical protein